MLRTVLVALLSITLLTLGKPAAGRAQASAPPQNPLITQVSLKIIVSARGIQEVIGANALAAGFPTTQLAQLQLWQNGLEIPLEIVDADANSVLSANDMLRFYAAEPGQRENTNDTRWRWNNADTYWLSVGGSGLRIPAISLPAGIGTPSAVAIERGVWRHPRQYVSQYAGLDRDRWFAKKLPTSFDDSSPDLTLAAQLAPTLPLSVGVATYTVSGTTLECGQHTLILSGSTANATQTWSEAISYPACDAMRDWRKTFTLSSGSVEATLAVSNANARGLLIDEIAWELPVALTFSGTGAVFTTPASGRYQISGLPTDTPVYDISEPASPSRIALPADGAFVSGAAKTYLIAASGMRHIPALLIAPPLDLSAALAARVVYIAPTGFHAALAPLVAHRQSQGYSVALVNPQWLYDTWSYGNIDPRAIRSFLRAAASDATPLEAAILVGDGTVDPFSQGTNFQPDAKPQFNLADNVNIIPPYLADVDPFIHETACDACYAQLDGDDPKSDLRPDIALGRLPVKNATQLAALVAKLLRYETGPINLGSASRVVFIADDPDGAGDFAAAADAGIALQPTGITTPRLYFDPNGGPNREPDWSRAYTRTLDLLNEGAGIVNYVGHGSISQWASTDLSGGTLLSLYDPDGLRNGDRLPIVLSLTCATSMFHISNTRSTSIDERWLLNPNNGAIATWGSSGNGLLHDHAALQHGFYTALWTAPRMQASLGQLTRAGIDELIARGGRDEVFTFLLLGDPLTRARVAPASHVQLPLTAVRAGVPGAEGPRK